MTALSESSYRGIQIIVLDAAPRGMVYFLYRMRMNAAERWKRMIVNRNPEYFLTVVRERNISRAAEQLYLSQSSLSQHIAKLETAMEVKLFDRSQNPLTLTEAGNLYCHYLESEMDRYRKFQTELGKLHTGRSQTVSLGLGTWRGSILFPEILPVFLNAYPQARINLHEYPVSELIALVQSGKLDFAVMNTAAEGISEEFASETIARERILLVTNRKAELTRKLLRAAAGGERADLQVLGGERYISLNRNLTVGRHVFGFLEKNLSVFPECLNTTNNSTALKLAAEGLGFCFLVETGIWDAMREPELTFFDLQTPELSIPLSVIYRKNGYLTPLSQCLITVIREYYRELLKKNEYCKSITKITIP